MSKRGYISRYLLIIKKLKAKPYSTFEELKSYLENQFDFIKARDEGLNVGFSLRTFQRDVAEISKNFGIDIEYSKEKKGYVIINSDFENMNFRRMMEAFDLFNSLNLAHDHAQYIHLEKRRLEGTENIYGLLHAIKNKLRVKFSYQKYWEDVITYRELDPYGLKEFKQRWYVLGKDKVGEIKTFGLDRIADFDFTKERFELPKDYNIEESFQYSFGITGSRGKKPEDITLSFDYVQGQYIKSLKLHSDQKILFEDSNEVRVKLKLFVTHDLIMELLSYGDRMMVLQPESLANLIREEHRKAFEQY